LLLLPHSLRPLPQVFTGASDLLVDPGLLYSPSSVDVPHRDEAPSSSLPSLEYEVEPDALEMGGQRGQDVVRSEIRKVEHRHRVAAATASFPKGSGTRPLRWYGDAGLRP